MPGRGSGYGRPLRPVTRPVPVDPVRKLRGYILSREWRDEGGGTRLTLWAATDEGSAKIVVENIEPVLFLRRSGLKQARKNLPRRAHIGDATLRAMDGEPVQAVYFATQRDLEHARDAWLAEGVDCLEADVPPAERFLMERFIRGAFSAAGDIETRDGFRLLLNPRLSHDEYRPDLAVCSIDIETSEDIGQLYSIAFICGATRRVLLRGAARDIAGAAIDAEMELCWCEDERQLLLRFLADMHALDPDVLIGWNVVNFDLAVLVRRCKALKVPFELGRDRGLARVIQRSGTSGNALARVPGRVVLDGIECLRSAFWAFESYALDAVARELLGRGKAIEPDRDRASEITRLFNEDKLALARYNLEDCRLVLDIFERTRLLEFVVERTRLTGLAMGRQGGSVAAFDYLYLPRLHRKGWVGPSVAGAPAPEASPGGYVLDSVPGIHENVAVLDFKSLYPSIIRTFHIDPLGRAQPGEDPIPGFIGARFSRDDSLLPGIIEELWRRRDEARRRGDQPLSQAIKILMNSFYGVLGTDRCRFYHPQLASSITRRGHEIIRTSKQWIEDRGYKVIYGDTDSLFVLLDKDKPLEEQALDVVAGLNLQWQREIENRYRLHSYLELELETLFRKFFMPRTRGRETGSKKRYAGMTGTSRESLVIKGLEAVRSDWTELARSFQRELLYAVMQGEDPEAVIHRYVGLVRSEKGRSQLVYRKRLRRPLGAYSRNVPPHVRAARQLDKPASEVRYCMTLAGPQPVEKLSSPLDYEHYIERQIKPVADAVLPFVGLDFDRMLGGQGELFC
ncbi:MAG: DNA polymerase II [Arenicellales bacterium]